MRQHVRKSVATWDRRENKIDRQINRLVESVEGAMEWWSGPAIGLALIVLIAVHVRLTKSNVQEVTRRFWCWCQWEKLNAPTQLQIQQKLRYEKELLRIRLKVFALIQQVAIQGCFVGFFVSLWKVMNSPTQVSLMQSLPIFAGYIFHSLIQSGIVEIKTNTHFRCFEVVAMTIYAVNLYGLFAAPVQLDMFVLFMEEALRVSMVLTSVVFIDVMATFPVYLGGAMVLTCKKYELLGFELLTPMMICSSLIGHLCAAIMIAVVVHTIQCNIQEKIESQDASSLLMGFQNVLKGVSDGNVVLDRNNFTLVHDTSSLEQLLKSDKKLADTNFLDLFLDTESRQSFRKFLNTESAPNSIRGTMPRCFRVCLQGSHGHVSADIFCTGLPNYGSGNERCLIVLKEDAEHFLLPPGPPVENTLPITLGTGTAHSHSRASSISEMLEAVEELVQMSMLVSHVNKSFDIEEVTLSFDRSHCKSPDASEMPTLRKLIRIQDWDRVEQMFQRVCRMPVGQHHILAQPLVLRIPGTSRRYIRATNTSIALEEQDGNTEAGEAICFWMQLSGFDKHHLRYPKESEMAGIAEEQQAE